MPGIAVSFLAEEKDRSVVLQNRLDSAQVSRTVFSHNAFPITPTDPILRQIQDVRSEVVFIDIDPAHPHRAISAIELIHATTAEIVIFAVGEMTNPATIVSVMRAGAREYLDRNASTEAIAEAFARHTAARNKARASSGRARIFTITNAKGGAGATTVAVNTAIALQEMKGNVLLVDFAPLGHTALHLNVRPTFGLPDALQNLHRMDASLLEGLMTECKGGLRLLAGSQQPFYGVPASAELARLFDLLVAQFQYVIVDCSNRVDQTARMLCDLSSAVLVVAQTDVVSLWSAGRMRTFLEEGGSEKVRLVLNRYKKIPGFTDDDVEKATDTKLLWKIPNNFQAIAPAIDKGIPVAFNDSQEIGRSFRALAATLAGAASNADGGINLTPQASKTSSRFLSPLRAER